MAFAGDLEPGHGNTVGAERSYSARGVVILDQRRHEMGDERKQSGTGEKPPKDGPEKIRARKKKSDLLVNADPELIGDPVRIEGSVPILRRPSNHSIRNLSPPVHAGGFFIAPHAEVANDFSTD